MFKRILVGLVNLIKIQNQFPVILDKKYIFSNFFVISTNCKNCICIILYIKISQYDNLMELWSI